MWAWGKVVVWGWVGDEGLWWGKWWEWWACVAVCGEAGAGWRLGVGCVWDDWSLCVRCKGLRQ